jgi:hypothetical protein
MSSEKTLEDFSQDIRQQVIAGSDVEGEETFREDKFTELMIEYLTDAGEIDDGIVCSYRAKGLQVNGYSLNEDEESFDIFISKYLSVAPPETVGFTDVSTGFKRGLNFVQKSFNKLHESLEEASPVFDLSQRIYEVKNSVTKIRLIYLTDGIVKDVKIKDAELDGIIVSHHLWDIERLFKVWTSGKKRETIEIDFEERFGYSIPCLKMPKGNPQYTTYLAIFPANVLVDLYGEYGTRLLERNVRSFLQARGQVNSGIRKTILEEPYMFLAYNNGIAGTSEIIDTVVQHSGGLAIKKLRDFQIVNGAQTTASLYHATRKDKADVSEVFVQVKLTVIDDVGKMDEFVPLISQYSNSQNKVQTADFSANDPFHRQIEELSRTIWAPAQFGTQRQTRWYYERARGQYTDDKNREGTPARKKAFEAVNPNSQKFTKTDLAKYEDTWDQLPHLVSRGAQKNFREFTLRLRDKKKLVPNQTYFEHLVAKAILFKSSEKIVQARKYGGYRANIVTYTLALISHLTAQRINLDYIWRNQSLSPALQEAIDSISELVFEHIVNAPGNANVTEWCKKEECWKKLQEKNINIPQRLMQELLEFNQRNGSIIAGKGEWEVSDEDREIVSELSNISPDVWFKLSAWAKQTDNLQPWQRGIAYSMGSLLARGSKPSRKQTEHSVKILDEAKRLGFTV